MQVSNVDDAFDTTISVASQNDRHKPAEHTLSRPQREPSDTFRKRDENVLTVIFILERRQRVGSMPSQKVANLTHGLYSDDISRLHRCVVGAIWQSRVQHGW